MVSADGSPILRSHENEQGRHEGIFGMDKCSFSPSPIANWKPDRMTPRRYLSFLVFFSDASSTFAIA